MSLAKINRVRHDRRRPEPAPQELITIGEMARLFSVSLRTLRFYEDRGLLVPRREGTTRYYTSRDKERLQLVLHGKNLGFTLVEIREMLANADKQLDLKPEQIQSQIAHLERQRGDIDRAIAELRRVQEMLASADTGRIKVIARTSRN